ncbi:MAG: transposase [Chitinophagales bacterium]|nr:transposase [Chitinophagales bacterium]
MKKNIKKQNLSSEEQILLRKRALIECVNDQLKNICKIEHSKHKSVYRFMVNLSADLSVPKAVPEYYSC